MTLTPANQLTLLRMLLIPAFVILVVYGHLGWALFAFTMIRCGGNMHERVFGVLLWK